MKYQSPDQLVNVSNWQIDGDFSPYPEGSRTKSALFCPSPPPFPFLIGDHRYLFKLSNSNFPAQFWAEIIAYRLGCLMDVAVPEAFAAMNTENNQNAALISWFYGPKIPRGLIHHSEESVSLPTRLFRRIFGSSDPETDTTIRYVSGGDYMVRWIPNYDLRKGRQHNVTLLMRISGLMEGRFKIPNPVKHWAKVFLFDAVIGNTDRHQDNWGIIWYGFWPNKVQAEFAPAFDNGTSLGHEIMEENLPKFKDERRLLAYIERGTHHIRLGKDNLKPFQHAELIEWYGRRYPETINVMVAALNFDLDELERQIFELTALEVFDRLSEERAAFIFNLIRHRRDRLLQMLGAL